MYSGDHKIVAPGQEFRKNQAKLVIRVVRALKAKRLNIPNPNNDPKITFTRACIDNASVTRSLRGGGITTPLGSVCKVVRTSISTMI